MLPKTGGEAMGRGDGEAMRGKPGHKSGERGVYITLDRQIRHGVTKGCPGCEVAYGEAPKKHNAECRARFEKLVAKEQADAAGSTAHPDAGSTALSDAGSPARPDAGSTALAEEDPEVLEEGRSLKRAAEDKKLPLEPASQVPRSKEPRSTNPDAASSGKRRGGDGESTPGSGKPRAKSSESGQPCPEQGQEKKAKLPEPQGEKRKAVDPVDDDRPLRELIGGMPTLHEWEPVAAYPEWGKLTEAFDERTGGALPLEKVRRARGRELDKMLEHNVKEDITWEEARKRGLKIVKTQWVDGWKALPDDPQGVRSRLVAQEVNTHDRDDVFSGTPPLKAHRMVVSSAATSRKGRSSRRKLLARYDVSVAFFHAVATGKIAVVPPKDLDQSVLWFLLKAMNGTREASRQWAKRIVEVMTGAGFLEVPSVPGLFYHEVWDLTLSCHGDDFLASGESDDLDRLDELMVQAFETKVLPRIGPPEAGGQVAKGDHLRRIISWSEKGYSWEADPKYAKGLIDQMGLTGKGVDTPSRLRLERDAEMWRISWERRKPASSDPSQVQHCTWRKTGRPSNSQ